MRHTRYLESMLDYYGKKRATCVMDMFTEEQVKQNVDARAAEYEREKRQAEQEKAKKKERKNA